MNLTNEFRFAFSTVFTLLLAASLTVAEVSEQVYGPPVPPDAQYFNCTDPALWTSDSDTAPFLSASSIDGIVSFTWAGALHPSRTAVLENFHPRDPKRYSSWIKAAQTLPIQRGHKGEVRVVWHLAVDNPQYGSMLTPVMLQFDKDGNEIGYVDLTMEWLPTQPGYFRQCGLTWNPPAQTVTVAPALRFQGNALNCRVKSICLFPAPEKVKWDAAARTKDYLVPPLQYQPFPVTPQPDSVKRTPRQIDDFLASYPAAYPKITRTSTFRTELLVNGKRVNPAINLAPHCGNITARFNDMEDAGVKIHAIQIKAGPTSDTPDVPGNIWLGKDRYNFEPVRQAIRDTISRAPDSFIMLHLIVNVYNDWGIEHPGDVHANAKGEKAVCGWSRPVRYGGPPPNEKEFWEASSHSKQFRQDGAAFLKALGQWLNSVPEGKIVIGAYINGSVDGQWLFSSDNATGQVKFACYSPGALNAFRDYLRERYPTDQALSAAWGFDVTFDTAQVPDYLTRSSGHIFQYADQSGQSPLMSYNAQNRQAADYNQFLSVSNTRRQIAFCQGLKEGSAGRLLCGSWWPTLPAAYPLSHSAFDLMLNSPYVDFISRGGLLGAAFHGKMTVDELDLRNIASGLEAWTSYDGHLIAKSQGEYQRQINAWVLRAYASGGTFHLYDMWGGWFWHPQTMRFVKDAVKIYDFVKDGPSFGENYVGVFVDENAANHLVHLGRHYMTAAVQNTCEHMQSWGFSYAWGQTGLPVRFFLTPDALNPDLILPKVAIFLSPLTMTTSQAQAIHDRFDNNGRVIAYFGMPGLAAPGDIHNPQRITGFDIHEDHRTHNLPLVRTAVNDPLLTGIAPDDIIGFWRTEMSYQPNASAIANDGDTVLATYAQTDIPGLLVKRAADHTTVWSGFPGAVTPQLVRNLAREAGMTPWLDSNNELVVGAGLLGVIGIDAGPVTVTLPTNIIVKKCLSSHTYTVDNNKLTFELGFGDIYGDVALFSVRDKLPQ